MVSSFSLPQDLPAWHTLSRLASGPRPGIGALLDQPGRSAQLIHEACGLQLDATRQAVDAEVLEALNALAVQSEVQAQRDAMVRGEPINTTEQRPVLHMALRGDPSQPGPWGAALAGEVEGQLQAMLAFADAVRRGAVRGHTGAAFSDVLHIGIGGSDLGPRMATDALAAQADGPHVHYLSNPDAWAVYRVLRGLEPARTLVIVSSKTFTTPETLRNADTVRQWLLDGGCSQGQHGAHLAAVTASPTRAAAWGCTADRCFRFWDWVGGRYSLWSAIGLPLAIAIGPEAFRQLLAGARAMDAHFVRTPIPQNMPVQLALMGVWNHNFLHRPTQAIVPYATRLAALVRYLQQMDMESSGKRTHNDGRAVQIDTGPIVWGGVGIDGQHAYFQSLHQGTHTVPVDFIGVAHEDTPLPQAAEHHAMVQLNLRAQAEALARGRSQNETLAALRAQGLDDAQAAALAPHRRFGGNTPSNVLTLASLTPATLGALLALYEHKVFTQAAIWRINAYDQWGVELGKTLAQAMASRA